MTYQDIQAALNDLQAAIEAVNTKKGYDNTANAHYTIGYMQSMFAGIVLGLSKGQQAKVMKEINSATAYKTKEQ